MVQWMKGSLWIVSLFLKLLLPKMASPIRIEARPTTRNPVDTPIEQLVLDWQYFAPARYRRTSLKQEQRRPQDLCWERQDCGWVSTQGEYHRTHHYRKRYRCSHIHHRTRSDYQHASQYDRCLHRQPQQDSGEWQMSIEKWKLKR